MDPAPEATLAGIVAASPLQARYGSAVDNESAYELLAQRVAAQQAAADRAAAAEAAAKEQAAAEKEATKQAEKQADDLAKMQQKLERDAAKARAGNGSGGPRRSTAQSPLDKLLGSMATTLGREITRGVFGTRRR
jgi:membrane protein involved in colicin uptake